MPIRVVIAMPIETIIFVTSNSHKFDEVKHLFSRFTSFKLMQLDLELPELQSFDLEKISTFALKSLSEITNGDIENFPVFVEDSGLFIRALKGFPGPFSSFSYRTLGLDGILTLMQGVIDRKANFQSSIAFKFNKTIRAFNGLVNGRIAHHASGSGWGYDPIFIPDHPGNKTYGDLGEEKKFISHRYLATKQLIEFIKDIYKKGKIPTCEQSNHLSKDGF
ncbi:MAG: non-canonical purine NTP pyrophosphatase [Candidatus Thorarchaeota archaeon]